MNAKVFVIGDKVRLLVVQIGKLDGAKVYARGANIGWKMKRTHDGYATFKFVAKRKGVITISSPRACKVVRVGVKPPLPPGPPAG